MTVNVENILKVADAIEQHSIPDLGFYMGDFVTSVDGFVVDMSGHNCGTVACIAGWAYCLRNQVTSPEPVESLDFDWPAEAKWLGLDEDVGQELFYGYRRADQTSSADAVAVLRHLASTGEVNWAV